MTADSGGYEVLLLGTHGQFNIGDELLLENGPVCLVARRGPPDGQGLKGSSVVRLTIFIASWDVSVWMWGRPASVSMYNPSNSWASAVTTRRR